MTVGIAQLAAAYAAGVGMSLGLDISFILIFVLSYLFVCLLVLIFGVKTEPMKLAAVGMFCLGAILTSFCASPQLKSLAEYENLYVTIEGKICETPEKYDDNYRYFVNTHYIIMNGERARVREKIIITSPAEYRFGDSAAFTGFVKQIPERLNESGFDLKLFYKSKDCFFKCHAQTSAEISDTYTEFSPMYISSLLRNSISQLIDKYTYNDTSAILKAVIIGDKNHFSEDFDAVLTRTGTKRFFYPAFMHIMILTGIMAMFSSVIKKKYRDILTVIFLCLTAVFESPHPIALKACAVAAFLIIFRRRLGFIYFADVLGAAVLAIGIANPLIFYNAGFVMSVTASISVNCFIKPLTSRMKIKNRYVKRTLAVGIICTVTLIPLSAYYFHGISPYTIITAFVFLPATLVILLLSPLLLCLLALFGTAPVIGEIVTAMIWLYMKLPYAADALPFSHITIGTPSITAIIAFYTLILAFHLYNRKKHYAAFLSCIVAAGFFLVVCTLMAERINTVEFNFVNVGQGDGAVIQVPYKNTVLIDGGGGSEYGSSYDNGKEIYVPYLESMGITRADCAIVSHCHKDHADGIIAAIKTIRVRHLYLPETPSDNEVYRKLRMTAIRYGTEIHVVKDVTRLTFNSGLTITLIPPAENVFTGDDENDRSLLARVSYGETDCTFTGDMPKIKESALLSEGYVAKSEILKVAHHGSDTSSGSEFLDAVSPDFAVISVGKDNSYGLPSRRVLERLEGASVLRTDVNGDITIIADKNRIKKIRTFR